MALAIWRLNRTNRRHAAARGASAVADVTGLAQIRVTRRRVPILADRFVLQIRVSEEHVKTPLLPPSKLGESFEWSLVELRDSGRIEHVQLMPETTARLARRGAKELAGRAD